MGRSSTRSTAEQAVPLWGWLPAVSLVQAAGVFLVAQANVMSRADQGASSWLFWLGLLAIVLPTSARLLAPGVKRRERLGLVVALALALYLVKVVHSPVDVTFADEFIHLANVQAIRDTGHLFNDNSILPVTPLYPGLHIVTATVAGITGLTDFAAALIVIGAARVMLLLSIFMLVEATLRSAQVASLAVILYTANSNFLYWTAQFAYESLALPLAGIILFAIIIHARWRDAPRGVLLTAGALIPAVIVTHHLTSYALAALLLLACAIFALVFRRPGPWKLALLSVLGAAAWLSLVASTTVDYLFPVVGRAARSMWALLTGEQAGRTLFAASGPVPGVHAAPLWERVVALSSVPLIVIGVLAGLWIVWRHYRDQPYAILLALIGAAYVPTQALRLTSAGWETANRASEFLFVGVAFLLALALRQWWRRWYQQPWLRNAITWSYVTLLFLAGVIAGWQPALRTGRVYQVAVQEHTLLPQGVSAAQWSETFLGEGNVMIADSANARLMLTYGGQSAYTGRVHGIRDLFFAEQLGRGEYEMLDVVDVEYVVYDERLISWDNMLGIYFERLPPDIPEGGQRLPEESEKKFDRAAAVDRVFDSGEITIFDVREVLDAVREP